MKIFNRNKKKQRLILINKSCLTRDAVNRFKEELSDKDIEAIVLPKGFDVVAFDGGIVINEVKKL